jgi:DNA replication protein DnaC
MERLSNIIGRTTRERQDRAPRPANQGETRITRLPVGSFLGEDEEDDEDQNRESLPRANRGRIVDDRPPTAITQHRRHRHEREIREKGEALPVALVPPPGVLLPPLASAPPCPVCKGAGYLRANVPYGHPNFGKPLVCECQLAKKNEARRQLLRRQSQIDELAAFREATFENFQFLLPGVQEAYETAIAFAHHPSGWLLLAGKNGCGKTHLAVSIAKHCLDDSMIVLFAVVPDLLDYLRATFAPNAEEDYDEAFMKMREAELLVLDDLGAEHSTPWANEKLYQLLNYRYNARLATVITTNNTGFAGIEDRIRSRLSDKRLVHIVSMEEAQDFRMNAAWE